MVLPTLYHGTSKEVLLDFRLFSSYIALLQPDKMLNTYVFIRTISHCIRVETSHFSLQTLVYDRCLRLWNFSVYFF